MKNLFLSIICFVFFMSFKPAVVSAEVVDISNLRVENIQMTGEIRSNEVSFAWDKVEGVEMYEIWKLNVISNGYEMLDETAKTDYTIKDLESGTSLSVLVRGYCLQDNGEKMYCNFSEKLVVATKPDNMEDLHVETMYSTKVELRWKLLSHDCSYKILRRSENETEFTQLASSDVNSYTDTAVTPSSIYVYKVYAYIKDTELRSDNDLTITTMTCPASIKVSYTKGGDGIAKIKWSNTIVGDGYIIYIKDENNSYSEVSKSSNIKIKECIIPGLEREKEYRFRVVPYIIYEGIEYKSFDEATEVTIKTEGQIRTSIKATIFKTFAKFKKAKLIKKYKKFSKTVEYLKSIVMPGLSCTNVNHFGIDNMVNQAICIVDDYLLMSAYDPAGQEHSVIYVMNPDTKEYICTIALPDYYHVGGMTSDGINIWISTGKAVSCFGIEEIKKAVESGEDSYALSGYKAKCTTKTQASFVTYYNDRLWIGEHNETQSTRMYGYMIIDKSGIPSLKKMNSMKIPSRTQDVLFLSDGKILLSRSNQIKSSVYYISELCMYKIGRLKNSGVIKKKKNMGNIDMPPMLEGIAYRNGYLYTSYESASISSCTEKLDRIVVMKYKKIKWK